MATLKHTVSLSEADRLVAVTVQTPAGTTILEMTSSLPGVFQVRGERWGNALIAPVGTEKLLEVAIVTASDAGSARSVGVATIIDSVTRLGRGCSEATLLDWLEEEALAVLSPGELRGAKALAALDRVSNQSLASRHGGRGNEHPAAAPEALDCICGAIRDRCAKTPRKSPSPPHLDAIERLIRQECFADRTSEEIVGTLVDFGASRLGLVPFTDGDNARQTLVERIWNCMPNGPMVFGFAQFASICRDASMPEPAGRFWDSFLAGGVMAATAFLLVHAPDAPDGSLRRVVRPGFHWPRRRLSTALRDRLIRDGLEFAQGPEKAENELTRLLSEWVDGRVFGSPFDVHTFVSAVDAPAEGSSARSWRRLPLPEIDSNRVAPGIHPANPTPER